MHGLINQAIERFVCDAYGRETWEELVHRLGLGVSEFEAMLTYERGLTERILAGLAERLDRSHADILEDIGTYLVSHPESEVLRRLLRFGGADFVEFLHSLDELPERARLAVPDLDLPPLELRDHTGERFSVMVRSGVVDLPGFGHVVAGALRALADDYGALALLDCKGGRNGTEIVEIRLLESAFAAGREFDLGAAAGS